MTLDKDSLPKSPRSTLTAATALLQELWRRAYKGEAIEIRLDSVKEAKKLRLDLYQAVRDVRRDPALDLELHLAITNCTIVIEEYDVCGGAAMVKITPNTSLTRLQSIAAQTGIDLASLPPPVTAELPHSTITLDAQIVGEQPGEDSRGEEAPYMGIYKDVASLGVIPSASIAPPAAPKPPRKKRSVKCAGN